MGYEELYMANAPKKPPKEMGEYIKEAGKYLKNEDAAQFYIPTKMRVFANVLATFGIEYVLCKYALKIRLPESAGVCFFSFLMIMAGLAMGENCLYAAINDFLKSRNQESRI